jgi:DNA (cytosine-5)-methyltransferase 1
VSIARPLVLELFAGIGGLSLGLERAGFTVAGQVEINPFCRAVLARHWPEVPRHDDVRTAAAWWAARPRPLIDLVAGGFPCQPFARNGFRLGTADGRWGWPWMADVVRLVRPRYVLVENVAALLDAAAAFGWVLADLAALGFDAEWGVLPACAVGAPHTRDRLFLVAYAHCLDGLPRLGDHPDRQGPLLSGDTAPGAWRDHVDRAVAAAAADGRGPDGVPAGLDAARVTACGNAVVPDAARYIGRLIAADLAAARPPRPGPVAALPARPEGGPAMPAAPNPALPPAPGPVIAAGRWRQVIDRAGERCECTGQCGRKHREGKGRCTRPDRPGAPLHAVPRDPAPFHVAAALPASALHALCDRCHGALAAIHDRGRQAAHGALSATETLF